VNSPVPGYLIPYVLSCSLAIMAAVLFGLYRALQLARWPDQGRRQAFWTGAAALVAWFLVALWLSRLGFYRGTPSRIPAIQYGLLIPILLGVALFWRWPALRRVVQAVPQEWIVSVQLYRVLGAIFLALYAAGRLPGAFAWPAGVGDVMVGLLAPVVGIAYARRTPFATGLVRAWNLFGIGDLVVAVTTGFLTSPSPLQRLAFDAPNVLIGAFPLVMIPVFLVPLSILLHLASLQKLSQTETARQTSPTLLASEQR
jgi:hypothetical protein